MVAWNTFPLGLYRCQLVLTCQAVWPRWNHPLVNFILLLSELFHVVNSPLQWRSQMLVRQSSLSVWGRWPHLALGWGSYSSLCIRLEGQWGPHSGGGLVLEGWSVGIGGLPEVTDPIRRTADGEAGLCAEYGEAARWAGNVVEEYALGFSGRESVTEGEPNPLPREVLSDPLKETRLCADNIRRRPCSRWNWTNSSHGPIGHWWLMEGGEKRMVYPGLCIHGHYRKHAHS